MSISISTEDRFKRNFMTLIDICEEMVQEGDDNGGCGITPMMFSVIKIIGSRLDAKNLIERFIRKTHNHWGNIQERNIDYFKQVFSDILNIATERGMENVLDNEDKKITGELNMTHVGLFKRLLSMNYVVDNEEINLFNDERIDMTWKIMHSFVKQSILFIHETRDAQEGIYTQEYFPEINIKENAANWKIRKILSGG